MNHNSDWLLNAVILHKCLITTTGSF